MQRTFQEEIFKTKIAVSIILIAICFFAVLILLTSFSLKAKSFVAESISEETPEKIVALDDESNEEKDTKTEKIINKDAFSEINLKASSAIVWDINKKKVIFEKNSNESIPLASITKLMTALVALEKVYPSFAISIDPEFLKQYGNSGLYINEKWSLDSLIEMSLITSANDASFAIASVVGAQITGKSYQEGESFFISEMNRMADKMNLSKTFFYNSTGLDVNSEISGAYSSAQDVVNLTLYLLQNHPGVLFSTRYTSKEGISLSNLKHTLVNTNPTVYNTEGLLASKTGYTDLAGGNLMVVVNIDFNYPVIIVVMDSTFDGRYEDVKLLIETTKNYLQS